MFEAKRPALDNGMVRQLVGYRGIPLGQCPDSMLTEALDNISGHFAVVLIRGRMKQSIEMLGALLGTPLQPVGRANVNPRRDRLDDIPADLRRRIRELNRLDDRLFRLMLERFPATYERVVHGQLTPGPP